MAKQSKKVTLESIAKSVEDLAMMTANGFKEVGIRIDNLKSDVDQSFEEVNERLDQIEFNTNSQERRITILEDKVRMISVKIGLAK